jgi:hypothetical protein
MTEFIFLFVWFVLRAGSNCTFDILLSRVDFGMDLWDISLRLFLDVLKIAEIVKSEQNRLKRKPALAGLRVS